MRCSLNTKTIGQIPQSCLCWRSPTFWSAGVCIYLFITVTIIFSLFQCPLLQDSTIIIFFVHLNPTLGEWTVKLKDNVWGLIFIIFIFHRLLNVWVLRQPLRKSSFEDYTLHTHRLAQYFLPFQFFPKRFT